MEKYYEVTHKVSRDVSIRLYAKDENEAEKRAYNMVRDEFTHWDTELEGIWEVGTYIGE